MEKHTEPGDVVLVHLEDRPAGYARIEEIRSHVRPGWFECDLLFLGQPLQPVTWILERDQMDGTAFTMGGRPVRIERIVALGELHGSTPDGEKPAALREAGGPEAREDPSRDEPKARAKVLRLVPRDGQS